MSYTTTATRTYSVADIEIVVRRFAADLAMIAQSTGAISEAEARRYTHDIELLAKNEYLEFVDVTLLSGGVEVRAARWVVNPSASDLTMTRPGGVDWPRVENPFLRIVLSNTKRYDAAAERAMRPKLQIPWTPTSEDVSHVYLARAGRRDYASNGWGLQRQDFGV